MKKMLAIIGPILTAAGIIYLINENNEQNSNEKCCQKCANTNKVKYYSIDTKYDRCGECCLNPNSFWLFKLFESGLTLANDKTCSSLGYTIYEVTESHGFPPIKVTIDKYKKPE